MKNHSLEKMKMIGDFFYAEVFLIFLRVSELRKDKKYKKFENLTGKELLKDIYSAGKFVFGNQHNYKEAVSHSSLFTPILAARPQKYIKKISEEFKASLKKLKNEGKLIIMITNSHYGFFEIIFHNGWGEDYLEIFDLVGMKAEKPAFWNEKSKKIYKVDITKPDSKDPNTPENFDFFKERIWLEGSYEQLRPFLEEKLGKKDFKGVYFGDNPKGDMQVKNLPNWDSTFIFAELGGLNGNWHDVDFCFNTFKFWGSNLKGRNIEGKEVDSYLYGFAKNCCDYVFDSTSGKECLRFLNS